MDKTPQSSSKSSTKSIINNRNSYNVFDYAPDSNEVPHTPVSSSSVTPVTGVSSDIRKQLKFNDY